MTSTCTNTEYGSCESIKKGEEPDMRLGDTCVLCCCFDCERCGVGMDLDAEIRITDKHGGFEAVCERCVGKDDTVYDLWD